VISEIGCRKIYHNLVVLLNAVGKACCFQPTAAVLNRKGFGMSSEQISIIKPISGWRVIDFKELKGYRDLFYFLVWRDIKILYAQTILGFTWAVLQPLIQIIIFTVVFGKVAKISTEGIPYFLFSTVAVIPWTYISQSMTESSQSLVTGQHMLGKVYFPRLIFPLTAVLSNLVGFGISMLIVLCVTIY